ncbi:MAG: UDP-2,4-diacetamido-2,4,6-trideoxy-beta-L-altropyranose hydrolase [Vampirovibrio sp.]|nr:UDP-2,4-diacetamido-2,4,6-trideoxy-beta-L-altropyranose hydrolase [Vampirovibrio sp.]
MPNQIIFRADASVEIGTGHIMRCLTLAQALQQQGHHVQFICRQLPGNLIQWLQDEKQMPVHPLPPDINLQTDADLTQAFLKDQSVDWVVVDHYALDATWESVVKAATQNLMAIDDLANRSHEVDVMLNQNLMEKGPAAYQGWVPDTCQVLCGPQYALLRPVFASYRKPLPQKSAPPSHLLMSFGGSDPTGESLKAIQAVGPLTAEGITLETIVGLTNPRAQEINAMATQYANIHCYDYVDNMAQKMATAHLFIGAGGTTSWERCCLGLPSVILSLADNQTEICQSLHHVGAAHYLGVAHQTSAHDIQAAVMTYMNDPSALITMSNAASALVDGQGCSRVIQVMREIEQSNHKEGLTV